ncbi:hypothetical protein Tco_0519863 [Tanacetum coccineum]
MILRRDSSAVCFLIPSSSRSSSDHSLPTPSSGMRPSHYLCHGNRYHVHLLLFLRDHLMILLLRVLLARGVDPLLHLYYYLHLPLEHYLMHVLTFYHQLIGLGVQRQLRFRGLFEDGFEPYVPRETGLGVDFVDESSEPSRFRGTDLEMDVDVMRSNGIDIDPEIQVEIDEFFAYADALRDRGVAVRVVVEAIDREEIETGDSGFVMFMLLRVSEGSGYGSSERALSDDCWIDHRVGIGIQETLRHVGTCEIEACARRHLGYRALRALDKCQNLRTLLRDGGGQEEVNGNGGNRNGGNRNGENKNRRKTMVPNEKDKVKRFVGGLPYNIQGNVISAEPTKLQDAIRIANNLMGNNQFSSDRMLESRMWQELTSAGNNEKKETGTRTEVNEATVEGSTILVRWIKPDSNVSWVGTGAWASGCGLDRDSRSGGSIFGLGQNTPSEKFSGDGGGGGSPEIMEKRESKICTPYWKPPIFYDDDDEDDEESCVPLKDIIFELPLSIAITPDFPIMDSLIMEDEHLDTILETKSDEENESSVEDLNLTPNTSIVFSPKVDSLLEEFSGELAHIDLISPEIDEADFDPEEEIHLVEKLLYDNSSPRSPEELNSENFDVVIESFAPSPIPVEDSDTFMEEIDIFLAPDDSIPPGIENDDYDSEGDILFLEELLSNDSISLLENESFHFDRYYDPSSPRPPKNPLDDDGIHFDIEPDTGILTAKLVDDISEHYVLMPSILPTHPTRCPVNETLLPFSFENENKVFKSGILAYNEEKSHHLLSHRGFKAFQIISDFSKSPIMIYGGDSPILEECPDYKDSRARGFVLRSLELQSLA